MKFSGRVIVEQVHWIFGRYFTQQCWTIEDETLTVLTENRETRRYQILTTKVWSGTQYGIQIEIENGEWLRASASSKVQWAMWLEAFQNMSPPSKPHSPIKVKFCDVVGIYEIPQLTEEEKENLFFAEPHATMCV